jgi:hypothetical protein
MDAEDHFKSQKIINKKRYDALYSFFIEKHTAQEIADQYEFPLPLFIRWYGISVNFYK